VHQAHHAQLITARLHKRRNDSDPEPGFGEREQVRRRATLQQNIRGDAVDAANCVECLANRQSGVEQQQRMPRDVGNIQHFAAPQRE